MKTVNIAGHRATTTGPTVSTPYVLSAGKHGATLGYDTGKAKGSIPVAMTAAELSYALSSWNGEGNDVEWDGSFLAVLLVAQPYPEYRSPMSWRILVAALDSKGRPSPLTEFASGTNALGLRSPDFVCGEEPDCLLMDPPIVVLGSDLIAYNVQRPTSSQPDASEILLRSMSDGTIKRDIRTPQYVFSLQLSGTTLAWMEFPGDPSSFRLRTSTAARPGGDESLTFNTPVNAPEMFEVPPYLLADTTLTWGAPTAGKVWQRDLSTEKLRQISPDGLICQLLGAEEADAVMGCSNDASQSAWFGVDAKWVIFWSSTGGARLLTGIPDAGGYYSCQLSGGSLWVDFRDLVTDSDTYWEAPIFLLTGH